MPTQPRCQLFKFPSSCFQQLGVMADDSSQLWLCLGLPLVEEIKLIEGHGGSPHPMTGWCGMWKFGLHDSSECPFQLQSLSHPNPSCNMEFILIFCPTHLPSLFKRCQLHGPSPETSCVKIYLLLSAGDPFHSIYFKIVSTYFCSFNGLFQFWSREIRKVIRF
jgi:hypothetical protein